MQTDIFLVLSRGAGRRPCWISATAKVRFAGFQIVLPQAQTILSWPRTILPPRWRVNQLLAVVPQDPFCVTERSAIKAARRLEEASVGARATQSRVHLATGARWALKGTEWAFVAVTVKEAWAEYCETVERSEALSTTSRFLRAKTMSKLRISVNQRPLFPETSAKEINVPLVYGTALDYNLTARRLICPKVFNIN